MHFRPVIQLLIRFRRNKIQLSIFSKYKYIHRENKNNIEHKHKQQKVATDVATMYHWPENSIKHSKTNKILSSKKLNSYKIDNHNGATKLATTAKKASLINKLVHELAERFMFERFGLGWRLFVNRNQNEKWKDTFGENAFFGRFVREMSSYDTNFMRNDLQNGLDTFQHLQINWNPWIWSSCNLIKSIWSR